MTIFCNLICISVKPDSVDVLAPILAKYKIAQEANKILYINFTSVVDYMWLLRAACECLAAFDKRAVLYLAAAVSDFYIPSDKMVTYESLCLTNQISPHFRLIWFNYTMVSFHFNVHHLRYSQRTKFNLETGLHFHFSCFLCQKCWLR